MVEETTARQVVFGAVVFAAILGAGFGLISNFLPDDVTTINDYQKYNNTVEQFAGLDTQTEALVDTIENPRSNGLLGFIDGVISGSVASMQYLWGSVSILKQGITALGYSLHIPAWLIVMSTTIIFLTLAFSIIALLFKWKF